MNNNDYSNFDWDELLERIECKKIIPVIGQGLYWIEEQGKEVLLYDYLAEKLTREIGIEPFPDMNQKFSKAAFEYLKRKNNNYLKLSKFLSALIREVKLIPHNPLWKLARVKAFNIFINTAYDDFLVNTIKAVRDFPTEVHFYTLREKKLKRLEDQLFEELEESKRTLVFNLYGIVKNRLDSAFTEKDILETIVEFQKDIKAYPENNLFQALEGSSLLSEIYYAYDVKEFVDILFEKLEKDFPGTIIAQDDFPRMVFISFHGANRAAAVRLASHLREDGIDVWLDEREFEPGAEVDDTIVKAINSAVFSPDGMFVLTASRDHTARLWDLNGNFLAEYRHNDELKSASFSPDGAWILTTSADGVSRLWYTPQGVIRWLETADIPQLSKEEKRKLSIGPAGPS